MASPGCQRWQHKGRTSTNPALNRYGRSCSALYRGDMAMEMRRRFDFVGNTLSEMGFSRNERDCRAMVFVGYFSSEEAFFGHMPVEIRLKLAARQVALICRP